MGIFRHDENTAINGGGERFIVLIPRPRRRIGRPQPSIPAPVTRCPSVAFPVPGAGDGRPRPGRRRPERPRRRLDTGPPVEAGRDGGPHSPGGRNRRNRQESGGDVGGEVLDVPLGLVGVGGGVQEAVVAGLLVSQLKDGGGLHVMNGKSFFSWSGSLAALSRRHRGWGHRPLLSEAAGNGRLTAAPGAVRLGEAVGKAEPAGFEPASSRFWRPRATTSALRFRPVRHLRDPAAAAIPSPTVLATRPAAGQADGWPVVSHCLRFSDIRRDRDEDRAR